MIVGTRFDFTPTDSVFIDNYRVTQEVNGDLSGVLTNTAVTELVGRQAWREVEF